MPREITLISAITAIGIIGNGGFLYWYENMWIEDSRIAAHAFDELGFATAAGAMRTSMEMLSVDQDLSDYKVRSKYIAAHEAELDESFMPFDGLCMIPDDVFKQAAFEYIHLHRAELVAASPEYKRILK